MPNIDRERRRISAVVLLYGPAGSGRTTAMYALARQLPAGTHGKVSPLPRSDGRLLRLDYRPHDEEFVRGFQVTFRLISVTGEPDSEFLKGIIGAVDGVLFVADSSTTAGDSNALALANLDAIVRASGRTLAELPRVVLYNKRDVRDAVDVEKLQAQLNREGAPHVAASAIRGQGVLDGLQRLTASVAVELRREVSADSVDSAPASSPRTTPHGMTIEAARAMQPEDPRLSAPEDVTAAPGAVAPAAPARAEDLEPPPWNVDDDDRTDVHGTGTSSSIPAVGASDDRTAPSRAAGSVRVTSGPEDRTSPSLHGSPAGVAAPDDRTAPPGLASPAPPMAVPDRRGSPSLAVAAPEDLTSPPAGVGAPGANTSPRLDALSRGAEQGGRGFASLTPLDKGGRPAGPSGGWQQTAVDYSDPEDRTSPGSAADPFGSDPLAGAGGPTGPRADSPALSRSATSVPEASAMVSTRDLNESRPRPQPWEAEVRARAIRVPVPDLAGYVISRIGTPMAMSRLALRVPVRVTHLDTLSPEDYVLDLEMREGTPGLRASARSARHQPVISARREPLRPVERPQAPWKLIFAMVVMVCATMIIVAAIYNSP